MSKPTHDTQKSHFCYLIRRMNVVLLIYSMNVVLLQKQSLQRNSNSAKLLCKLRRKCPINEKM